MNNELVIKPNTVEQAVEVGWKTAKEIYTDADVDERTWTNFKKTLTEIDFRQKINRSNRNGGPLFSPEVEKQFQAWLMRNQISQGKSSEVVKAATTSAFNAGISLQVIIESGNEEAFNEYMGMARKSLIAQRNLKLEQQKNHQLQLENKKLANENDYLKKVNEINTAQIGYYTKKYHSWQDDYENY